MKFIPKNDKNSVKKKRADREKLIRNKYLNISENEVMLVLYNFEECFQFNFGGMTVQDLFMIE